MCRRRKANGTHISYLSGIRIFLERNSSVEVRPANAVCTPKSINNVWLSYATVVPPTDGIHQRLALASRHRLRLTHCRSAISPFVTTQFILCIFAKVCPDKTAAIRCEFYFHYFDNSALHIAHSHQLPHKHRYANRHTSSSSDPAPRVDLKCLTRNTTWNNTIATLLSFECSLPVHCECFPFPPLTGWIHAVYWVFCARNFR